MDSIQSVIIVKERIICGHLLASRLRLGLFLHHLVMNLPREARFAACHGWGRAIRLGIQGSRPENRE